MKNRLFKLALGATLLLSFTTVNAEFIESKMVKHIVHNTPWVEVRLPYDMTAKELAHTYYGNADEAGQILKANKSIGHQGAMLRKNMTINIPVTVNFKDQPERLGWVQ